MIPVFLIIAGIVIAVYLLYKGFNYAVNKRMAAYAKRVMLSDLRAIRAQMNPHFIFNSLNSINRYILKNEPDIASDYLGRFAKLIRLILDNSNNERIPLAEEMLAMQLYVELEQLRFEHAFRYEVEIAKHVDQQKVLVQPLIFQPVLENAIWHGLMHKEEGDRYLSVKIDEEDGKLICSVRDNGVGRKPVNKEIKGKKKSYGINLVRDRLKFLDSEAELIINDIKDEQGAADGTLVILKFKKSETYNI